MMTATEMRNKVIEIQTKRMAEAKADAINWVETEAILEVEKAANNCETFTYINYKNKNFTETQKAEVENHFRKNGYSAVRSDTETIRVAW